MRAEITPGVLAAAYKLDDWHNVVEDEVACLACGDEFEAGQQALDVRVPEFGDPRMMATVHLHCYQGEDVVA